MSEGRGRSTFEVRVGLHVRIDDPWFFDLWRLVECNEDDVDEDNGRSQRQSAHWLRKDHGREKMDGLESICQIT